MQTLFIVNPQAGNGRAAKIWTKLEVSAKQTFAAETTVAFTEFPKHAVEICRDALASGAERIIAVGGDGTLNEVANGFFKHGEPIGSKAVLGVLPLGSGCDFARSVSMSGKPAEVLQWLKTATPRACDVGLVRFLDHDGEKAERYFINIADFGLGGAVAERLRNGKKRWGANLSYLLAIFATLSTYHNPTIQLQIDDQSPKEAVLNSVIAANGQFFGAGLRIAPNARVDDGQFDIVLLKDLGLIDIVLNLARARKGNHLTHPMVEVLRGRKLTARSTQKVAIDIDGESVGALPVEMLILPAAIRVLAR